METTQAVQYINQRRASGITDGQILDELVAVGWDKTTISGLLFGQAAATRPTPNSASATPVNLSQADLQVVSTQGSSEQTRMGILTAFLSTSVLVTAYCFAEISKILLSKLLGLGDEIYYSLISSVNATQTLITYVSIGIPFMAVALFCNYRLGNILAENPSAADDIYYRKNIRTALRTSAMVGLASLAFVIYNVLNSLTAGGSLSTSGLINWVTTLVPAIIVTAIFWNYSKKSSR